MPPTRRITKNECETWFYGPQVSDQNKPYALGQFNAKWGKLITDCKPYMKDYFKEFYEPDEVVRYIKHILTNDNELYTSENMLDMIVQQIQEADPNDPKQIRMVLSTFIITYGILLEGKLKGTIDEVDFNNHLTILTLFYKKAHYEAKKRLDEGTLVSVDDFLKLNDPKYITRTKNALSTVFGEVARESAQQKIHPIAKSKQSCDIDIKEDCANLFKNVKNWPFKPLARVIGCHCSLLKQRLKKIKDSNLITLTDKKNFNIITTADYSKIKEMYGLPYQGITRKPAILIKKYKETKEEGCNLHEERNYLSQLFTKVCSLLYKPFILKPIPKDTPYTEEELISINTVNALLGHYRVSGYCSGHLNMFHTSIIQNALDVYFLKDDGTVYMDIGEIGPPKQFFYNVIQELLIHNIFIESNTFFKNKRYTLNLNINIEEFPFYKDLHEDLRTPEIKEKLTNYFYLFIGNLIHFAVVNNIELPFKLSRIHISQLFSIFNITVDKIFSGDLDIKLLLISLFLLEKAPEEFTKIILKIFENPNVINPNHPDEDEKVFNVLTSYSKTFKKDQIFMNDLYTIEEIDRPLYSDNEETLFYNMVDYLYKTSLKFYFMDINSSEPVTPDTFKLHPHLHLFIVGFKFYKEYHETDLQYKKLEGAKINYVTLNLSQQLALMRKLDFYLTGGGIVYDNIKDELIPLLRYKSEETYYRLNDTNLANFINTLPNSLNDPDVIISTDMQIQNMYWLIRILLDRGKTISKNFINLFNQNYFGTDLENDLNNVKNMQDMSNEDYHNEFVKLLLKSWTGIPTVNQATTYKVHYNLDGTGLPSSYTCFNYLTLNKSYSNPIDLYEDLVIFVTEGTKFGEALAGGSKHKKVKKNISKSNGIKNEKKARRHRKPRA